MRLGLCFCLLAGLCASEESEDYVFGFLRTHPERASLRQRKQGPYNTDLRGVLIFRGI